MKKCLWCNKELKKSSSTENNYSYVCYCKTLKPYYSCVYEFINNNLILIGVQFNINNNYYRLVSFTEYKITKFYINTDLELEFNYSIKSNDLTKFFNKILNLKSLL